MPASCSIASSYCWSCDLVKQQMVSKQSVEVVYHASKRSSASSHAVLAAEHTNVGSVCYQILCSHHTLCSIVSSVDYWCCPGGIFSHPDWSVTNLGLPHQFLLISEVVQALILPFFNAVVGLIGAMTFFPLTVSFFLEPWRHCQNWHIGLSLYSQWVYTC